MNSDAKCNTPDGLSLLDFPFFGAAFASRNAAEGGGEGRKIRTPVLPMRRMKPVFFTEQGWPWVPWGH